MTEIQGTHEPRFARVREVFEKNFASGEVGAAVAVTLAGEPVVDLWGGHADAQRSRPWERDTLVNVYSTTKGMTALCAHRLIEEGRLDPEAPVSELWPEFARAGKDQVPVRWLLSHQVGLPAIREPLPRDALYDWDAMVDALAAEEPWWEPGTRHGYHALTFGFLVGELVRRVDGRSLGTYFHEELAEPLGLDFHIGLPEELHRRCADMIPVPPKEGGAKVGIDALVGSADSMTAKAFSNPPNRRDAVNTPEWRSAEIPAGNGHGDARSLARIYGALASAGDVDGVRVLGREAVDRAREEQAAGPDAVLMNMPMRFGMGFMLPYKLVRYGPNREALGHPGAGGSIGFADPEAGLGFAYVMNQMQEGISGDARGFELIAAVYECMDDAG